MSSPFSKASGSPQTDPKVAFVAITAQVAPVADIFSNVIRLFPTAAPGMGSWYYSQASPDATLI
uniref:Uncharacterized protein n=1 Tax=Bionectria ochroleuca TaxID=29856 RepID=A0A0B7JHC8_BIOOC